MNCVLTGPFISDSVPASGLGEHVREPGLNMPNERSTKEQNLPTYASEQWIPTMEELIDIEPDLADLAIVVDKRLWQSARRWGVGPFPPVRRGRPPIALTKIWDSRTGDSMPHPHHKYLEHPRMTPIEIHGTESSVSLLRKSPYGTQQRTDQDNVNAAASSTWVDLVYFRLEAERALLYGAQTVSQKQGSASQGHQPRPHLHYQGHRQPVHDPLPRHGSHPRFGPPKQPSVAAAQFDWAGAQHLTPQTFNFIQYNRDKTRQFSRRIKPSPLRPRSHPRRYNNSRSHNLWQPLEPNQVQEVLVHQLGSVSVSRNGSNRCVIYDPILVGAEMMPKSDEQLALFQPGQYNLTPERFRFASADWVAGVPPFQDVAHPTTINIPKAPYQSTFSMYRPRTTLTLCSQTPELRAKYYEHFYRMAELMRGSNPESSVYTKAFMEVYNQSWTLSQQEAIWYARFEDLQKSDEFRVAMWDVATTQNAITTPWPRPLPHTQATPEDTQTLCRTRPAHVDSGGNADMPFVIKTTMMSLWHRQRAPSSPFRKCSRLLLRFCLQYLRRNLPQYPS
ncbi:hypothetical protein NX059_004569 [Plenodomus lindquistii]|nr:hypothetical protein NX059_004569 [Plenodomus lindquistii]